jgi:hypothetical protein
MTFLCHLEAKKISTATTSPDAMPVINEEPQPSTSSTTIPPADLESTAVTGEQVESDLPLKDEAVEILSQALTSTEKQWRFSLFPYYIVDYGTEAFFKLAHSLIFCTFHTYKESWSIKDKNYYASTINFVANNVR